ncbi:hypothetical protein GCM10010329_75040 [Streptomyces spiroverticillatus]|uniref:Uncharacterized protein n=1 Tax=Streptomyces finlayi TaxID=67296 RepID=A0A918X8W8_9ACTN|nr:hypothetical protein GCM10010329_75040 [Streptomyces spiroverticillatus]GHD16946.1 hypothetical protein GCM10010334_78450 [Streptomyces finlayi]
MAAGFRRGLSEGRRGGPGLLGAAATPGFWHLDGGRHVLGSKYRHPGALPAPGSRLPAPGSRLPAPGSRAWGFGGAV